MLGGKTLALLLASVDVTLDFLALMAVSRVLEVEVEGLVAFLSILSKLIKMTIYLTFFFSAMDA